MKQLQHTSETCETLKTYACNMRFQHSATSPCCFGEWRLVDVWSSPEAAARRWQPRDAARRQRPHDWERDLDPPGSHSCPPCCAGPLVTGATSAVAPPCRGPLGPPRRGPLTPRPLLTLRPLRRRREREIGRGSSTKGMRERSDG